ncbi:MAG: xanthine dehydrogenase family protein molybdopterin-binding subunit [Chloroflexi bacterium]|nr:xanthine dehydrogenase family protein molybdopterin-binding subunit [Chloroflexota bacterium]
MPPVRRRTLLRGSVVLSGGLVLWIAGCGPPASGSPSAAARSALDAALGLARAVRGGGRAIPNDVDAWLRVDAEGVVTLASGKVEFGQGIQTAFGQLVADELDLPFASVRVVLGSTDSAPFDTPTTGSASLRTTGLLVRQAAAELRQWLLALAAQRLGAPVDALSTTNGRVLVTAQPERTISYAELAAGKPSQRQFSGKAPLKSPEQFACIGQSVARVDVPAKVDGSMTYGYDATVPGMLHGKILRAPSLGASLATLDIGAARAMPGVAGVVQDGDFVGLAADRLDHAQAALEAVSATWNERASSATHETIFDLLKGTPDQGRRTGDNDSSATLGGAAQRLSVRVTAPYLAHLSIEPQSALARPNGNALEVWASTQAPFEVQSAIAGALHRPLDSVVVHAVMAGGAFGRKAAPDAAVEAARLAIGLGRPVRVSWTRDEEFQLDQFRPAMLVELETGLDASGGIVGWTYDLYAAAYYESRGKAPMFSSADAGAHAPDIYAIPHARTIFYQSQTPLPVGIWRANGAPVNALARETALDQLAEMAGVDPVSFRARLLADNPRMLAVLRAAVQKAGWTPAVGRTGQGVGVALDTANGTWVAEVARVAVDTTSGVVRVEHVDVAVDCGLVVNPGAARSQIEGGVIGQGVSSTLKEQVTFANGRITNATFQQYGPLRATEAPTVDVVFLDDRTQPMQGLGEPAVGPVSAAISNALYDAVGVRLRDLPFTPDRVLTALLQAG